MSSFFILASSHKPVKYSGLSTPTLIYLKLKYKKILKVESLSLKPLHRTEINNY